MTLELSVRCTDRQLDRIKRFPFSVILHSYITLEVVGGGRLMDLINFRNFLKLVS